MGERCGIYKITSPTGRIYIGQSVDWYFRHSKYKNGICAGQPRLYRSILKHGWEAHTFEFIHKCEERELNDLEVYYIKLYDTFDTNHGMNLSSGGNSKYRFSQETKQKMSKSGKGRKMSDMAKKKLSQSRMGMKFSEESKMKMRASAVGRTFSEETRKKLSDKSRGRRLSESAKKKVSEARKGHLVSPETRALISKRVKESLTPEIRKKISDASRRRVVSKETCKKRSESMKGEKAYWYGKKMPESARKKLSESKKGKPTWNKGKKFSKINGVLVEIKNNLDTKLAELTKVN